MAFCKKCFLLQFFLDIKKARVSIHKTAKSVLLGSPSDTVLKADFVRSWQYKESIISEYKNQHAVCFIFYSIFYTNIAKIFLSKTYF